MYLPGPLVPVIVVCPFALARFVDLFAPYGLFGLGIGFASSQLTNVILSDIPPEKSARLDVVATVLSALGLGLIVYAILRSGTWGFVQPKPGTGILNSTSTW